MPREILDEDRIHPAIRAKVATHENDIVREVQDAIATHALVIAGMKQNPHVHRARESASGTTAPTPTWSTGAIWGPGAAGTR